MNENQQILNEIFLRNKVKGKYKFDYNLSKHSWFGIGGNAEIFYQRLCDHVLIYHGVFYYHLKNQ